MNKSLDLRYILSIIGIITILFFISGSHTSHTAFASAGRIDGCPLQTSMQKEDISNDTNLVLVAKYPVILGESGDVFEYNLEVNYKSGNDEARIFDIATKEPLGWHTRIAKPYGNTIGSILSVRLEPNSIQNSLKVIFSPLPHNYPKQGRYVLDLEVTSGDLRASIKLVAVVTSGPYIYELDMTTVTGRLDITARPGVGTIVPLRITNLGTGDLQDIRFIRVVSEGWETKFKPSSIDLLEPGKSADIELLITPPNRTINADYKVVVRSMNDRDADSITLRVKVREFTAWERIGICIIGVIVTLLTLLIRRYGRR